MNTLNKYFLLLAGVSMIAACSETDLDEPKDPSGDSAELVIPDNGFGAAVEGASKTMINSDYSVSWQNGDAIAVWDGENDATEYVTALDAPSKYAVFTGAEVDKTKNYYALYPYSALGGFEKGEDDLVSVTATIPYEYTPVKDSFPFNPAVAYSTGDGQSFSFFNICGLIEFEINADDVYSVAITGNNNEDIAGEISIDCSSLLGNEGQNPVATVVRGAKSVLLQSETAFESGKYFVALLPTEFTEGMTISMMNKAGEQKEIIATSPFTLNRSRRLEASAIDAGRDWKENAQIRNAAELQAFINVVNASEDKGADINAKIAADIDLSGVELGQIEEFAGTLDGSYLDGEQTKNRVISNWETNTALFKKLTGTVKNITVGGTLWINATDDAAFIALENAGTISACVTEGEAKTLEDLSFEVERAVGAIAARTTGTIENCTNNATITLAPAAILKANSAANYIGGRQFVGGIAGFAAKGTDKALISNCENNALVQLASSTAKCQAVAAVGGILGGTASVKGSQVQTGAVDNISIANCSNNARVEYAVSQMPEGDYPANICVGGVAGYVEGTMTYCNNGENAVVYAHPFRSETAKPTQWVKCIIVGGVAGFVSHDADHCNNSGLIDVSGTFTSGSTDYGYIGSSAYSTVGGVFGKTSAAKVSNCKNLATKGKDGSAMMKIDFHMHDERGSGASIGGVIGDAMGTTVSYCENNADCYWEPRLRTCNLGGVLGRITKLTTEGQNCKNTGKIECVSGTCTGNQALEIRLGGVIGYAETSGKLGLIENTGDILASVNQSGSTYYVGGTIGISKNGNVIRGGSDGPGAVKNSGDITVTAVVKNAYIGGIVGEQFHRPLKADSSDNTSAVAINGSTNTGVITATLSAGTDAFVGGIAGWSLGSIYDSVNEGNITVSHSNGDQLCVSGITGYIQNAYRVYSSTNKGKLDVTSTATNLTDLRVAGMSNNNGQIAANGSVICDNQGDIVVKAKASVARLAGLIATLGSGQINGHSSGNISYTYTGDAAAPTVYAALGAGQITGATPVHYGTYSGDITMSGLPEGAAVYCGLVDGYIKTGLKSTYGTANNPLNIKKGSSVNGVEVSATEGNAGYYLSPDYLVGHLDGTAGVNLTNVKLID